MLLGGLWHGAAWHFVAWGAFHGFWLVAHRRFAGRRPSSPVATVLSVLATFHGVCLGWVLFRVSTLADVPAVLRGLADFSTSPVQVPAGVWAALLAGAVSHLLGASRSLADRWERAPAAWPALGYALVCAGVFVVGSSGVEFIYFQF